jgi:hypothetical protein
VNGQRREEDAAKADTMRNVRAPAVNHASRFGRWGFLEWNDVRDHATAPIREIISKSAHPSSLGETTFSRRGEGRRCAVEPPSPLAGEGGAKRRGRTKFALR